MRRPRSATARARRIARALRQIEARFGPGVLRRLGRPRPGGPAVPSGSLGLDLATGLRGFPRGHLSELVGGDSSGKTALLHSALAATQREGGLVALVDAEGSADGDALAACGIDLDDLLLVQPASAADALLDLAILARCGALDLLALSSVAALRDLALPAGATLPEHQARDLARLLARGLRVLTAALRDAPTAVVVTNDLLPRRPGHRSVGGLALRHFAALRILAEPVALLTDEVGGWRGRRVRYTVIKSKVGPPGGRAEVDVLLRRGVDGAGELVALGLAAGVVERHPLGLLHGRDLLGRGPEAARRRLAADPALAAALRAAIVAAHARPTAA
jgi:recombination protein RecA